MYRTDNHEVSSLYLTGSKFSTGRVNGCHPKIETRGCISTPSVYSSGLGSEVDELFYWGFYISKTRKLRRARDFRVEKELRPVDWKSVQRIRKVRKVLSFKVIQRIFEILVPNS